MTVALEGGEWSAARPGRTLPPQKKPGKHFTGGWVCPRAGLDGWKISSPPGFDPRPSSPVAQSLYRLSYQAHGTYNIAIKIISTIVMTLGNARTSILILMCTVTDTEYSLGIF